jgi:hypothetical protein
LEEAEARLRNPCVEEFFIGFRRERTARVSVSNDLPKLTHTQLAPAESSRQSAFLGLVIATLMMVEI